MNQGETLISILLIIIIYFLYHIAKQLSYLTGKRLKISFFNWQNYTNRLPKTTQSKKEPEKLAN